jgi:multidrug resistance efflux pump
MSARGDHTRYVVTREELDTMRAAVERCAELETELAKVTVERHLAAHHRANANDIATLNYKEAEGLRAELAKVTAERDDARRELDRALMDMAAGFAGITPVVAGITPGVE